MEIEQEVFARTRPCFEKLISYGFVKKQDGYFYEFDFANGDFRAILEITPDGELTGRVYDKLENEEYLPLRMESRNGPFVNEIRHAYREKLTEICDRCYTRVLFCSDQANRIAGRILRQYGDSPDFPWDEEPHKASGIFRHADSRKWYALIMNIKKNLLVPFASPDEKTDVMNLKKDCASPCSRTKETGVYPAYHMNHKLWISVLLDDTLPDDRVMELIGDSYRLTDRRGKKNPKTGR